MEKIKEKMAEVLQAFVQQELGNKITQFNMQGLTMIMFSALDEMEAENKPKKK